jgi:hypothetical protein
VHQGQRPSRFIHSSGPNGWFGLGIEKPQMPRSSMAFRMGMEPRSAKTIPKPSRKVSRSSTVIGRFAGTVSFSGPSIRLRTLRSASSGQQPVHRFVEPDLAVLDQHHHRRGGERLGHRGDAEERVAGHRRRIAKRLGPQRQDVALVAAADQGHHARRIALRDMALQPGAELREAVLGEG